MQKCVVRLIRTLLLWASCVLGLATQSVVGMADNRFLVPFLERKPFLVERAAFMWSIAPFFMTADHCYNNYGEERPLFDFGEQTYGVSFLDRALVQAGVVDKSLMRSDWQLPLTVGAHVMGGKFQGEGVALNCFYPFAEHWAVGARGALMSVTSVIELWREAHSFEAVLVGPGDEIDLIHLREKLHKALGMESALWHDYTPSDIEMYLQLFSMQDYQYKCRHLDASVALGIVVPTAVKKDWFNPASIPCGGNGHWGMYVEASLDAVFRQDLRGSLLFRVEKRFSKTDVRRIPVYKEPEQFGAILGPVYVDPGVTFIVEPYLIFEHIRDGLGAWIGYTLVSHFTDCFEDKRGDRTVPAQFSLVQNDSAWGSERVHLGFFYDIEDGRSPHAVEPLVYLTADIPVDWIVSRRSFKTYGISLGIESYF